MAQGQWAGDAGPPPMGSVKDERATRGRGVVSSDTEKEEEEDDDGLTDGPHVTFLIICS